MKKTINYISQLILAIGLVFAPMTMAHAQILKSAEPVVCNGTGLNCTGNFADPKELIGKVLRYGLGFLTLLVVLMVIYGGLKFILKAGNDAEAKKGLGIIKNSLIGLVIILFSWTIVNFVFKLVGAVSNS